MDARAVAMVFPNQVRAMAEDRGHPAVRDGAAVGWGDQAAGRGARGSPGCAGKDATGRSSGPCGSPWAEHAGDSDAGTRAPGPGRSGSGRPSGRGKLDLTKKEKIALGGGYRLRPPGKPGGEPEPYAPPAATDLKASPLPGIWATGP